MLAAGVVKSGHFSCPRALVRVVGRRTMADGGGAPAGWVTTPSCWAFSAHPPFPGLPHFPPIPPAQPNFYPATARAPARLWGRRVAERWLVAAERPGGWVACLRHLLPSNFGLPSKFGSDPRFGSDG